MATIKESAKIVLEKYKKPLHYKEITKYAIDEGLFKSKGSTSNNTFNSVLGTDIRNKGSKSDFLKVGPGIFGLNNGKVEKKLISKNISKISESKNVISNTTEKLNSQNTGKGGEFAVCSELLFRGFNASILSVDTGIDVVAIKDNRLYNIQVKTANINRSGYCDFNINVSSFEKHNFNSVYYIFVLRNNNINDYVIIPYNSLQQMIHEGKIVQFQTKGNKGYRVAIKYNENQQIAIGKRDNIQEYFHNNWGIIK